MFQPINKRHITIKVRERSTSRNKLITNNVERNPEPFPNAKTKPIPHITLPNKLTSLIIIDAITNLIM